MLSFKIQATRSADRIRDIPIDRNPHGAAHDGWTCYYYCTDYSTVGEVIEIDGGFEFVVESQHPDPIWGERVFLYSTSSYIQNEPWGQNPSNVFVYFRNLFWLASVFEPLQEWTPGAEYPKVDDRAWAGRRNGRFNFEPINAIVRPRPAIWHNVWANNIQWYAAPAAWNPQTRWTPIELSKILKEWASYTGVDDPSKL